MTVSYFALISEMFVEGISVHGCSELMLLEREAATIF